jgi:hypothetical protein
MLRGRISPVEYVRSFFGGPLEEAVMAGDDVWPGLLEIPLLVWTATKRLFTRRKI